MNIVGVLLAGGLARRMGGGDKPLRRVAGRSLLELVIERVRPQVAALVLNANGDPARFATYGLPVVADTVPDFAGPFAGILAGLDWTAANRPDCPMIVTVATDAPFLPRDLVARMVQAMSEEGADLACAASGGQAHPVIGLWPVRFRDDLRHALVEEGIRKVDVWTARYRLATAVFRRYAGRSVFQCQQAGRPQSRRGAAGSYWNSLRALSRVCDDPPDQGDADKSPGEDEHEGRRAALVLRWPSPASLNRRRRWRRPSVLMWWRSWTALMSRLQKKPTTSSPAITYIVTL